jgi:hypothetical protein
MTSRKTNAVFSSPVLAVCGGFSEVGVLMGITLGSFGMLSFLFACRMMQQGETISALLYHS